MGEECVDLLPPALTRPPPPRRSLALSLHAPTQELRQTIVPSAKAFRLDRLMAAVEEFQQRTRQRVFVEYVMLGPGAVRGALV